MTKRLLSLCLLLQLVCVNPRQMCCWSACSEKGLISSRPSTEGGQNCLCSLTAPVDTQIIQTASLLSPSAGSSQLPTKMQNICHHNHYHYHHHHHMSFMQLGHFLTHSGLTYQEVSSKFYHDSFCQLGSSVSLRWVIYFEAFYLHFVSSFSYIPVICPKFLLFLTPF